LAGDGTHETDIRDKRGSCEGHPFRQQFPCRGYLQGTVVVKLLEHDGKAALEGQGLRVPVRRVVTDLAEFDDAIDAIGLPAVLKAQVLSGGRGKRGLVVVVTDAVAAASECERLLQVSRDLEGAAGCVLIEQKVPYRRELFNSFDIDDVAGTIRVAVSASGGIDVEDAAAHGQVQFASFAPSSTNVGAELHRLWATMLDEQDAQIAARVGVELFGAMRDLGCEILEVNPLALVGDDAIVLDAKVTLDDNSPSVVARTASAPPVHSGSKLKERAAAAGLVYAELDGDVALISIGAGYAMAIIDVLFEAGARPANFVDTSGGVSQEEVAELAEIVLARADEVHARAAVVSFVLSATPIQDIVGGIVEAVQRRRSTFPIFATFQAGSASTAALSYEDAAAQLEQAGITFSSDITESVRRAAACKAVAR
jgi:succinyl-CoA synthetase beta subunit